MNPTEKQVPVSPLDPGQHQIAAILIRLSNIEGHLAMLNPARQRGGAGPDMAETRSLLAPAMHTNSENRHNESYFAWPNISTPISSDQYQKPHDVMESLSLRRDLSRPEDPPFGTWWTYTVEETLLWPILKYQGSINSSLDVILEDSGEDSNDEDFCSSYDELSCSNPRKRKALVFNGARTGLDDGTLVPELIESFLRNVHTKSPILEPKELRTRAARVMENGLDWDGETCQVVRIDSSARCS